MSNVLLENLIVKKEEFKKNEVDSIYIHWLGNDIKFNESKATSFDESVTYWIEFVKEYKLKEKDIDRIVVWEESINGEMLSVTNHVFIETNKGCKYIVDYGEGEKDTVVKCSSKKVDAMIKYFKEDRAKLTKDVSIGAYDNSTLYIITKDKLFANFYYGGDSFPEGFEKPCIFKKEKSYQ